MKIIELTNWKMPINNEEADLLTKFDKQNVIEQANLSQRERYLATQLVNKDVLQRQNQDGKVLYQKKV